MLLLTTDSAISSSNQSELIQTIWQSISVPGGGIHPNFATRQSTSVWFYRLLNLSLIVNRAMSFRSSMILSVVCHSCNKLKNNNVSKIVCLTQQGWPDFNCSVPHTTGVARSTNILFLQYWYNVRDVKVIFPKFRFLIAVRGDRNLVRYP